MSFKDLYLSFNLTMNIIQKIFTIEVKDDLKKVRCRVSWLAIEYRAMLLKNVM